VRLHKFQDVDAFVARDLAGADEAGQFDRMRAGPIG